MVNNVLNAVLEGLFPNRCALCLLPSHRPTPLCDACESDLQVNSSCCYRCAIPLAPSLQPAPERLCGHCLREPTPFDRVIAPWLYCERLAHLIHRWKFSGERRLTPLLAELWRSQLPAPVYVDVLIPVPLHWQRLLQRGFNQSEILSRQLRSAVPGARAASLDHRSVRRNRATGTQSTMGAVERTANLKGAFTVKGRYDNLRIAIVDDVLTTGATAAALARTLRGAGASHIEVWCLARTPAPGA